jgi:DNA helicase-2/ATP-dependent DNA helicase PcrA
VLYRSNTQGGLIESALRRTQIPYSITGGSSIFDRPEVKDIMAYLKYSLVANELSLRRIINVPARGVGEGTLEKMEAWAADTKINFCMAFDTLFSTENAWKELGLKGPEKTFQALTLLNTFLRNLPGRLLDYPVGSSVGENLVKILTEFGYRDHIYNLSKDPKTGEKKWQLVEIVGRILDSYLNKRGFEIEFLKSFVDAMSLRDDLRPDDDANKVQLMTLHASKGLEFPVVILAGLEEDLLPHKTLGSDIDEERRLFYVGLTRAQYKLILSRCTQRKKQGVVRTAVPSRFLLEIPTIVLLDFYGKNKKM